MLVSFAAVAIEDFLSTLKKEIETFCGEEGEMDDLTAVLVKVE